MPREIPNNHPSLDLKKSLEFVFSNLEKGVTERGHQFHLLVLGTIDKDNRPQNRNVVLRKVDMTNSLIRFHTDIRSNKIIDIKNNSSISLLGYDKVNKLQVRLTANAIVEESKAIRGDFTASEDDNVLVQGISGDKGGMGYFGLAYYVENKKRLSPVAVQNSDGKFVLPSLETVMDGSYNPLARPLFIYLNATKAAFDPNVKKFIDFYLKHAATLSEEVGYIPFSKKEYTAITNHYKTLKTGNAFKKHAIGLSVQQILDLDAANQWRNL